MTKKLFTTLFAALAAAFAIQAQTMEDTWIHIHDDLNPKSTLSYFIIPGTHEVGFCDYNCAVGHVFDCCCYYEDDDIIVPPTITYEGEEYTVVAIKGLLYSTLRTFEIPNTVKVIERVIDNKDLISLRIPASVERISGITYCPLLTDIDLPTNLESLGDRSLNSLGIKRISFPPKLTAIGETSISDNKLLKDVSFGSVQSVGRGSFSHNPSLESIVFPAGLSMIEEGAFSDCANLRRIRFESDVLTLNSNFDGCAAISLIECTQEIPIQLDDDSFGAIDRSGCTVVVPQKSVAAYMADPQWSKFRIAGDQSGVTPAACHDITVEAATQAIRVTTSRPTSVEIVDAAGGRIASACVSGTQLIDVPAGVYVVTTGSISHKVAVR